MINVHACAKVVNAYLMCSPLSANLSTHIYKEVLLVGDVAEGVF